MDSLDIHDKNDIAGKLYSYLEHEFLKKKDSSEMNKNKGGGIRTRCLIMPAEDQRRWIFNTTSMPLIKVRFARYFIDMLCFLLIKTRWFVRYCPVFIYFLYIFDIY